MFIHLAIIALYTFNRTATVRGGHHGIRAQTSLKHQRQKRQKRESIYTVLCEKFIVWLKKTVDLAVREVIGTDLTVNIINKVKFVGLPLHILMSIITCLYDPLGGLIKSAIRAARCGIEAVGC